MREGYGPPVRRAAAAAGVSVALHLVVAVTLLGGALLLGGAFMADREDSAPLIVDVVAAERRPASPVSTARVESRRAPGPPVLPPIIPLPAEERPAPALTPPDAAADVATEANGLAIVEESPPPARAETGDGSQVASAFAAAGESPSSAPVDPRMLPDPGSPTADASYTPSSETASMPQARASASDADEGAAVPDPRVNFARLDEVTRNPSVAAHAEGKPFVGRREVFEFLLDHPDFATHVTRVLRLGRYRMWRTDDGLFVDDGWGARGQVFVVQASSGRRVLYARGHFQPKLLPAIQGEAVVTIDYDVQPAGDGRDLLFAAISSQLKIDGVFGDLVATIANSVATEKAERESQRLVRMFARVLQAIEETPAALYASLRERPDVPQRELEQFRSLLKLP